MIDNENGSAGGLFTIISLFFLAGFLFVISGFVLDKLTFTSQVINAVSFPAVQLRYNVVYLMIMVFRVEPAILLLGAGVNHLVNAKREFSGAVPLGEILMSAFEMILGTIIVMTLTLYGGYGLDFLLGTTQSMFGSGGDLALNEVIQYSGNIFYGLMLIGLFGLVILFLGKCVSVVDYTRSSVL